MAIKEKTCCTKAERLTQRDLPSPPIWVPSSPWTSPQTVLNVTLAVVHLYFFYFFSIFTSVQIGCLYNITRCLCEGRCLRQYLSLGIMGTLLFCPPARRYNTALDLSSAVQPTHKAPAVWDRGTFFFFLHRELCCSAAPWHWAKWFQIPLFIEGWKQIFNCLGCAEFGNPLSRLARASHLHSRRNGRQGCIES